MWMALRSPDVLVLEQGLVTSFFAFFSRNNAFVFDIVVGFSHSRSTKFPPVNQKNTMTSTSLIFSGPSHCPKMTNSLIEFLPSVICSPRSFPTNLALSSHFYLPPPCHGTSLPLCQRYRFFFFRTVAESFFAGIFGIRVRYLLIFFDF